MMSLKNFKNAGILGDRAAWLLGVFYFIELKRLHRIQEQRESKFKVARFGAVRPKVVTFLRFKHTAMAFPPKSAELNLQRLRRRTREAELLTKLVGTIRTLPEFFCDRKMELITRRFRPSSPTVSLTG